MFVNQVMHAEGLVRILKLMMEVIFFNIANNERQAERRIEALEEACEILNRSPFCRLSEGSIVLQEAHGELGTLKLELHIHQRKIDELKRLGIERGKYWDCYKTISQEIVAVSHGSVKPPEWPWEQTNRVF